MFYCNQTDMADNLMSQHLKYLWIISYFNHHNDKISLFSKTVYIWQRYLTVLRETSPSLIFVISLKLWNPFFPKCMIFKLMGKKIQSCPVIRFLNLCVNVLFYLIWCIFHSLLACQMDVEMCWHSSWRDLYEWENAQGFFKVGAEHTFLFFDSRGC